MNHWCNQRANMIESVTHQYKAGVRVTGGLIGPRTITFYAAMPAGTRFASIRRVSDEIAIALNTETLSIGRDADGIKIVMANPQPYDVRLMSLIDSDDHPVPATTSYLGIDERGSSLLARLSSPDVAHVLVSGTTGSGKTELLRTMAASLAMTNQPSELALVIIDPKGRSFQDLAALPHITRTTGADGAGEALASLVHLMELRDDGREAPRPRIVVIIDELVDLFMTNSDVGQAITRLVQRGREAGIHIVAATQHPSASIIGTVMRANFPLRLVGRVVDAHAATLAAGRGGTDAHLLYGRGDFVAVCAGRVVRFQAATIAGQVRQIMASVELDATAGNLLPDVPETEEDKPDWLDEGATTLIEHWDWWMGIAGNWGSMTKLHNLLFPGKPNGGVFKERRDAILAEAQRRIEDAEPVIGR